jgi:hypothetical protein
LREHRPIFVGHDPSDGMTFSNAFEQTDRVVADITIGELVAKWGYTTGSARLLAKAV